MIEDVDGLGIRFRLVEPELAPIEIATRRMKQATLEYQKACYENVILLEERAEILKKGIK